jgi:hypothetical protein
MRRVRITSQRKIEAEDRTILICPVKTGDKYTYYCTDQCAWFRIAKKHTLEKIETNKTVTCAYCGDILIGEIKQEQQ